MSIDLALSSKDDNGKLRVPVYSKDEDIVMQTATVMAMFTTSIGR